MEASLSSFGRSERRLRAMSVSWARIMPMRSQGLSDYSWLRADGVGVTVVGDQDLSLSLS